GLSRPCRHYCARRAVPGNIGNLVARGPCHDRCMGVEVRAAKPEAAPEAVVLRRGEIAAGLRASLSAGLGMFPLGIAFGMLVVQAGLPWWVAPALSFTAYAGSLELLLVSMIVTAVPL